MIQKILTILFHLLFALTPFIWTPFNSELFEFNKMIFVYILTTLIIGLWLLKIIRDKKITIRRTPLDIPILLFLASQILSTIFSIDPHLSIFGYYSRSNGGLLSIICYSLLFFTYISNFTHTDTIKFLRSSVISGVIVSIWAIFEHFGASLSCLILTGKLNADCWVQDVQARVFASLGQPNWLAAYLAILIFPAIYFLITSTKKLFILHCTFYIFLIYTAFTFTYSRGATLGLIAGFAIFITTQILSLRGVLTTKKSRFTIPRSLRLLAMTIAILLFINLLFGSALTNFKLIDQFSAPARESITTSLTKPVIGTQLESGGTESGSIRLIVWQGALDIFKHYPIFGSGVETFALSYYRFRPIEHNLVSEWDFLYNKAHNEYLNYLSNTGLIGFLSYISIIAVFVLWSIKQKPLNNQYLILGAALLASYISNLVQNFFGFSVVITNIFFFLIPAMAFTLSVPMKLLEFKLNPRIKQNPFLILFKILILLLMAILISTVIKFWVADYLYAKSDKLSDEGEMGRAYLLLSESNQLNPYEPLYQSEISFTAANLAVALKEDDATSSAEMIDLSNFITNQLITDYPNNVSLYRNAIRTFYTLSLVDNKYTERTLELLDKTILLAPTDPKLVYNKALILDSMGNTESAQETLQKALLLKPNYQEAMDKLKELKH